MSGGGREGCGRGGIGGRSSRNPLEEERIANR